MQRSLRIKSYFSIADCVILLLIGTAIYGIVATGQEWSTDFRPLTKIDLSASALPYYTLLSAGRGIAAYGISLIFTLVVGYFAANSKTAERIILPFLDIMQSIPVLGFLPGLIISLVALFPNTNFGLELAAIIMIFTGQVWNMTFAFYGSLKSISKDLKEASSVIGLSRFERLRKVELPFSAVNLAWNSLMSMAGGWFFLIPCEAMTLGEKEYRLPGIGAYMDVAIREENSQAIFLAIVAMIVLIILMDFVIWRPILAWVQRFRLEEVTGVESDEPLMQIWIKESKILRFIFTSAKRRHQQFERWRYLQKKRSRSHKPPTQDDPVDQLKLKEQKKQHDQRLLKVARVMSIVFLGVGVLGVLWGGKQLFQILSEVTFKEWLGLLRDSCWTFLRVILALAISTLWAVPVGIWIGTSPTRLKIAQPIIQLLASFPAPMLYPLVITGLFALGVPFFWGSMLLILLGVQWYILFNVLAGAMRIPDELSHSLSLMEVSRWQRWKTLYLPSVYPSLVTGWITAAGGAWNASVVAEYIIFDGQELRTHGLGSTLTHATSQGNFAIFAASLTIMVVLVVLLNRTLWSRVQDLAETRYQMD